MPYPATIAITGASSGLGAALAEYYATPGTHLFLHGRDMARLESVAGKCRGLGAEITLFTADLRDRDAMAEWISRCDAASPIDLLIANAGISAGSGTEGEPTAQARAIFDVNVTGMLNTVLPAIALMKSRKRGQIALISSLAGMRGLPSSPAYSASKAAVKAYGEALRGALKRDGVRVSVVCPGYIRTPMTDVNDFPMPFLMEADMAAARIAAGLAANRSRIAFPFGLYFPLWLLSCLSPRLTDPLFAALPNKPSAG